MRKIPEWFEINEKATPLVRHRIAASVSNTNMIMQVQSASMLAYWFLNDTLLLANQANREGMHANALALTRQCVEAVSIIELGVCGHPEAEAKLLKWDSDNLTSGNLRAWLQKEVWPRYGNGLWQESWSVFMGEFAGAIQPYAHYGRDLAQWQIKLHRGYNPNNSNASAHAIMEIRPRAYDPQKATRITLFHALLSYILGRIWSAANPADAEFSALIGLLGAALGKSRYLDGFQTNWSQQFWALTWDYDGDPVLE